MHFLYYLVFQTLIFTIFAKNSCESDFNCSETEVCVDLSCQHKNLFPHILPLELFGIIFLFVTTIITTVAGIGGVLFLSTLMLMFDFKIQDAVPISITMVFINLLLRYIISIPNRHPLRNKSVINYDIALIFSPSIIIGNIFGGMVNTVSPTWLIMVFIILLMGFTAVYTGKKAIELKRKSMIQKTIQKINFTQKAILYLEELRSILFENKNENSPKKREEKSPCILVERTEKSMISYRLPIEQKAVNQEQIKKTAETLDKILKKEMRYLDYEKIFMMIFNLGIFVLLNLLKGSKSLKSIIGIGYCGTEYWIFQFLYIPIGSIYLWIIIIILTSEYKKKMECGYIFNISDIKWDRITCIQISINGILVGVISSLLGIGGAILSTPLLLRLKVEAQEASFTAVFMALFSSITSIIQFFISGKIKWDYAGFLGGVCLLGMIIGLKGILDYLKRKNKMYGIVFVLAIMIIVSIAFNIYSNVNELINNENSRSFHSIC